MTTVCAPWTVEESADFLDDIMPAGEHWHSRNGNGPADEPHRWFTLEELARRPELLAPPEAVVPRLAWEGRLTLLAAREKTGKSTLVRSAIAAKVTGRDFLGEPQSFLPRVPQRSRAHQKPPNVAFCAGGGTKGEGAELCGLSGANGNNGQ